MPQQFSIRRVLWAGPLTGLLAAAVNTLFYAATRAMGAAYLVTLGGPGKPPQPLPVITIVVATLIPAVGAMLFFALLLKITSVPLPPFISVAAMALVVSFGGPFSLPGDTSLTTKLLLCSMHVLAGAVIVGGLIIFTGEK